LSIFYQDPELRLRNCLYEFSTNNWNFGEWFLKFTSRRHHTHRTALGDFNPGVQPSGTPISVEVVRGGDVELNVMWRDPHGRVVSSSWSKSSGWDLPDRPNDTIELLNGSARSVYIALNGIKRLKQ
jgi:hypothetical protein